MYTLNKEHPEDVDLIERSLHFWQSKTGAHQGYSLTGASSISSALGKGNDALAYLNKLFGRFLSVNTLYRESGPVIETPLSGAQSIHDMLLQSWGGKIGFSLPYRMHGRMWLLTGCGQKELSRSLPIGKPGKRNLYW